MARQTARARHGSYLFLRGPVYWVRFHSPAPIWQTATGEPTCRLEKSTGKRDRLEAEIFAKPLEEKHKLALQAARPRFETVWQTQYEPGRVHVVDGVQIVAGDRTLTYINADGTTRTEPNGCEMRREATSGVAINPRYAFPTKPRSLVEAWGERPKARPANRDDAIFENYLERGGKKRTGVHGFKRLEAQSVWATFRKLTDNKPLKDCTAADAQLLVKHFQDAGNASATVHKKLVWLSAAVNLAIFENELTYNPFLRAAPKLDDALKVVAFDDDDMKAIRAGLSMLAPDDQLLVRLLACTGMRLGEAATIKCERLKDGVRVVHVGTKTDSSERDVPLPAECLPYLPDPIKGPMFRYEGASKRFGKWLDAIGITDPAKRAHSFRHRAESRLRSAKCPKDWRDALLGHLKTTSDKYGEYDIAHLKEWADKIGF